MADDEALAQRRLATPERQRRGWAVAGAALGGCLMLYGLAITRAYDLARRGPTDVQTIIAVGAIVGGAVAIAISIASVLRS
jgi:hypothetical protein